MDKQIYSLQRFLDAQEHNYPTALAEIKSGKKKSHWIWYIFPQLRGLGHSSTSDYYGIENRFEAYDYLNHPILGSRLREITTALLENDKPAIDILGPTDAMKVRSSMTLFRELYVEGSEIFDSVLEKFYDGERDRRTMELLRPVSPSPVITLTADNYTQHLPLPEIVAIAYTSGGAMGDAGGVDMITSSGATYYFNLKHTDLTDEDITKICPILPDYWEKIELPLEWGTEYYLGMGNHLFIHESIAEPFRLCVERFRLEHVDLYAVWFGLLLDLLKHPAHRR